MFPGLFKRSGAEAETGGSDAPQTHDGVGADAGPPDVVLVGERRLKGKQEGGGDGPGLAAASLEKRPRVEQLDTVELQNARTDAVLLSRLATGEEAAWWKNKAAALSHFCNMLLNNANAHLAPAELTSIRADIRAVKEAVVRWWPLCSREALVQAWIEAPKTLQRLRSDLKKAAQRADEATQRADEAEKALRVHSIERHHATDGHVELNSAFPTPTEIARQASLYVSGDFTDLLMGELLVAMPLRDVSAALRAFFVLIHTHVESTFGDARRSMLQLLGGADVSTVITESCIRRAFQDRWELMLQLRADALPEAVLRAVTDCTAEHPSLTAALEARPGARLLLERCGAAVLRLCALSALNEQNCRLEFGSLGTVMPISRDEHEVMDDTCKRGAPCVVLFPALRAGATLHVKAAVLAESYSLQ